jgi:flagellar hook-length control protein FliK
VLGSLVDGESLAPDEREAPDAQSGTDHDTGEDRGDPELGEEQLEILDGVADAGLVALLDAETAETAEARGAAGAELGAPTDGSSREPAEEGAVQAGRGGTGTELGRPEGPTVQGISGGAVQTDGNAPLDPSGPGGAPVPEGLVPSEEPISSDAAAFSHASTAGRGGNAPEAGRPEPAPGAEVRAAEVREPEGTTLRSDAGDSSSAELPQHSSGSPRGGDPNVAFEPLVSRVEGAPRSESAQLEGPPRGLPELPASNENAIVSGARMLANEGGGTARIQLFPPQLGGLELRVIVSGQTVELRIVADRAAVADLMQHHLPELRQVLQLPGLAVERVEVAHRESNVFQDDRDARPDGDEVGREDSSGPREDADREEGESARLEPWTAVEGFDPMSPGGPELQRVTSLGTIDVRA